MFVSGWGIALFSRRIAFPGSFDIFLLLQALRTDILGRPFFIDLIFGDPRTQMFPESTKTKLWLKHL